MKKYVLYKTINKINKKFYIGAHITENINDNYIGSGLYLCQDIKKYGKNNFKKIVLNCFNSKDELLCAEKKLLDARYIKKNKHRLYNRNGGGAGSWIYNNYFSPNRKERYKRIYIKFKKLLRNREWRKEFCTKLSIGQKQARAKGLCKGFLNKKHTNKFKRFIGKINAIQNKGRNNPQYNKKWISNLRFKKSVLIKKNQIEDYLA